MPKGSIRITTLYAGFGTAWIAGSSAIVWGSLFPPSVEAMLEFSKGMAYVGVTSAVLLLLLLTWERRLLAQQAALAEANSRLNGIMYGSQDLIAAWDRDKRLVAANPRYSDVCHRFFGVAAVPGMRFEEIFGHFPIASAFAACWDRTLAGESFVEIQTTRDQEGCEAWFETSYGPLTGADGAVTGGFHIVREITERVLLEREREAREREQAQAVASLTEMNAELERMAYIISHDLQEPLRNIVAFTQLLERRSVGDGAQDDIRDIAATVIGAAKRMVDLIRDLLQFSRLTRHERPLELVSTADMCRDALRNLAESIAESNALIEVGPLPPVRGDAIQIMQVFQNLIGNALKFRKPDSLPIITISAQPDGGAWRFCVTDNGIGFDTSGQDVFELFRRHHTAAAYPGTGIGLAICKRVIQRHGGRIWAESTIGDGSRFYFTLPTPQ